MIQEAIEKIQEMVEATQRVQVIDLPKEPADVYGLVLADGTFSKETAEPKPRQYKATSLTGLCQQIKFFNDQMLGVPRDTADPNLRPVVFVGRGMVKVLLGEEERRHSITMDLFHSLGFSFLREAQANAKSLDQKTLVWELRTRFCGNISPANFLPDIKQLRFQSSSDGEATVQTGRESLRRHVQAGVVMGDAKELAEVVVIGCPVYDGLPEIGGAANFEVAVDVNLSEQKLVLRTMPGECEIALISAHEAIVDHIKTACPGVTVFVDSAAN